MYGFDHTTHNWEAVALDTNGKLEVSASLDTTGLATETTLSAISTGQGDGSQITKIRGDDSGTARDVQVDTNGKLNVNAAVTSVTGTVTVDGSGVTQPVSGTFFQATQPVSAASLPLPTGAATETSLALIAGCENGGGALQVDIQADAVGLATSAKQTSLETKVGELNDNAFVNESVVVAATSMDNTTTQINCTNYAKVEVILKGTVAMNSTQVMLQWSDDNSTWYSPQMYQTLYEVFDADGTTSVGEQGHLISDVLAKYMRVRIYNPGASSDTVVCLIARIH